MLHYIDCGNVPKNYKTANELRADTKFLYACAGVIIGGWIMLGLIITSGGF